MEKYIAKYIPEPFGLTAWKENQWCFHPIYGFGILRPSPKKGNIVWVAGCVVSARCLWSCNITQIDLNRTDLNTIRLAKMALVKEELIYAKPEEVNIEDCAFLSDQASKWVLEGDKINESRIKFKKEQFTKRSKHLESGDNVFVKMGGKFHGFGLRGTIKEIKLKHKDEWDWKDEIVLDNVEEFLMSTESWSVYGNGTLYVERQDIEFTPIEYTTAEIQCPTCKLFH